MQETYDIAIIGCGPAGLSASIYASRYRLKNIVFGKLVGGTISEAHKVCNYPGTPDITGIELGQVMYKQAQDQGAEMSLEAILDIEKDGEIFKLKTDAEKTVSAKTIIIATGTQRNKLSIPGEDDFLGKGVSYCATCDAMFYRDKVVAVVGGSNAATMAATMLSDIAKKVYIIYRGTELRGEPAWIEEVEKKENVEILFTTLVTGLEGADLLERVKLNKEYNGSQTLDVNGLFIEIGSEPNVAIPEKLGIELDEKRYIKVDQAQSTNIDGVWAAGDCTTNSNGFNQVVTAVGEGGVAANAIYAHLKEKN